MLKLLLMLASSANCAGGLVQGIIHNINTADMEMAPVLAGLLMLAQAVLALIYLVATDRLRPGINGRSSA